MSHCDGTNQRPGNATNIADVPKLYAEIDRLRAALRHVCISSDICGYVWLHEICDGCRCSRAKIAKEGE